MVIGRLCVVTVVVIVVMSVVIVVIVVIWGYCACSLLARLLACSLAGYKRITRS